MPSIEKQKKANSHSKAYSRPINSEHDEQVAVIEWAAFSQGKYPALRLLYAIPNASGFKGKPFVTKNGVKLPPLPLLRKLKEGLKKGIPDLCLPVARGDYHALYIEMKRSDGVLSKDQIIVQGDLLSEGNCVATCYNADEAIAVITGYLARGFNI